MFSRQRKVLLGLAAALLLGLCAVGQASAATSFYHGKTLSVIVPYSPGGGHDTIARLLAPYIAKYVGASRVKIINKPGAGGLIGDNAIYQSKADGLTIGVIDTGGIFSQIRKQPGVDFDMTHYTILGVPDFAPHVFMTRPGGEYQTFSDLLNAKKKVVMLATGRGGASYELSDIILDALNIPHKMVGGFKGQHQVIATFLAGQGDLDNTALHHIMDLGNKVNPILLVSNSGYSKLPNVPYLSEELKNVNISSSRKELLRTFARTLFSDVLVVGPPSIPKARTQALDAAFKKAVENSDYQAAARKAHDVPKYTSGATIKAALAQLVNKDGPEIRRLTK